MTRPERRQRGFALLIVLWTMGFLALLGTRIVAAGREDTRLADNLKQQAVLQAAADGAVANVMFSLMARQDPNLRPNGMVHEMRIGQTPVMVRIENESDRVNLNTASIQLLRALIVQAGAAPGVANLIATAILDWRTAGVTARSSGAKTPEYRAAGRDYGPPRSSFQSVGELADVLGMTPALFERLAPHVTVLTRNDPDGSTHDPIVARALTDTAGVADLTLGPQELDDEAVLRILVTAAGSGDARYAVVVIASADFQTATPRINILSRERVTREGAGMVVASGR
jgi:general secretion pathway protein K